MVFLTFARMSKRTILKKIEKMRVLLSNYEAKTTFFITMFEKALEISLDHVPYIIWG